MNHDYKLLLNTPAGRQWQRIGTVRRAGIVVPLFSLYSNQSTGIGDIGDLKFLIDWCKEAGFSILQLLPLNEVGSDFSPYNAISSFAIEPMYISLDSLFREYNFKKDLTPLKKKYSFRKRVDYNVKEKKMRILWNMFRKIYPECDRGLENFIKQNQYWIKDYANFKLFKHNRNKKTSGEKIRISFWCWLQWHLYRQLTEIKDYASKNGVLIMGDLPLLVSRESADVSSHPDFFKMNYISGAPPDFFYKRGQLWGMPPYNWEKIQEDDYTYIKERLKFAQNFFLMFRIDHFIGLFRIWTVKRSGASKKINGSFDPKNEMLWEEHGKKILEVMLQNSDMLPTAEDLGVVPECSSKVLEEYGVCGTDWQRVLRDEDSFVSFKNYRTNSIATISTHDSSLFPQWWKHETTKNEKKQFSRTLLRKINYTDKCSQELIETNLETVNQSASIFSIQLLQEWLALEPRLQNKMDSLNYRINVPGKVSNRNWTIKLPVSLEKISNLNLTEDIREILRSSDRLVLE